MFQGQGYRLKGALKKNFLHITGVQAGVGTEFPDTEYFRNGVSFLRAGSKDNEVPTYAVGGPRD